MARAWLNFSQVSFTYDLASQPVFRNLSLRLEAGWTGVIGPNGTGKTTLLRLASRGLEPTTGRITAPEGVVYCPQRTDDSPPDLLELLNSTDGHARSVAGRLGMEPDWGKRWSTLSHGERKRAQVGAALAQRPLLLALDEPTNHLDVEARDLVAGALEGFRGVGLLVSHDRDLLDRLCDRCLFLGVGGPVLRSGSFTASEQAIAVEEESLRREQEAVSREVGRLRREAKRRAGMVQGASRRLSKKRIARKDHDAKAKIDGARLTGKDASAAARKRQVESRLSREESRLSGIGAQKKKRLGLHLRGARSPRNFLFRAAAGSLPLGEGRRLEFDELSMRPGNRIGLSGPNGTGKSTLVRHIISACPQPEVRVLYVPQEIDRSESQRVARQVRELPKSRRGAVLTVIDRLGSEPERVLESQDPSPGELQKLLLGLGLSLEPHLIVMDEPTNHLDLPSVGCLQAALDECAAALFLVSHDEDFLARIVKKRWRVDTTGPGSILRGC